MIFHLQLVVLRPVAGHAGEAPPVVGPALLHYLLGLEDGPPAPGAGVGGPVGVGGLQNRGVGVQVGAVVPLEMMFSI